MLEVFLGLLSFGTTSVGAVPLGIALLASLIAWFFLPWAARSGNKAIFNTLLTIATWPFGCAFGVLWLAVTVWLLILVVNKI